MKTLLCLLSVLTASLTANAQGTMEAMLDYAATSGTPALSPVYAAINGPVGWTFQPRVGMNVTALGAFNYLMSGPGAIKVGLWNSSGTLLTSNSITATSASVGQSLYQSVAPVRLDAWQTYYLAAFLSGSQACPIVVTPGNEPNGYATMAPEIELGVVAFKSNSGFAFPSMTAGFPGYAIIAPNFQFSIVPEPSTLGLLGGGMVLWLGRRRKFPVVQPRIPQLIGEKEI
jgi:hypothetical protein